MLVTRRLLARQKTVRIVAPSSPFRMDFLRRSVEMMRTQGLHVCDFEDALQPGHPFLNGDDDSRVKALIDALKSDVDVVWLARGGYGLTRILPQLHRALQEAMPHFVAHGMPTVIGFSDATALFCLLHTLQLPCIHGPLATSLRNESNESQAHLFRLLAHDFSANASSTAASSTAVSSFTLPCVARSEKPSDDLDGPLFCANLCVLTSLVGTPFMPSLKGHLVVLEEVGERPYRIDRMLQQLHQSGAFDGVKALITGHLTGCDEEVDDVVKATSDARFVEWTQRCHLPWFSGISVGHASPNYALPQGVHATLRISDDKAELLF